MDRQARQRGPAPADQDVHHAGEAEQAAEHLQRHRISARPHLRAPARAVGDALGALAVELGADLVVMGCYGHSRARERLFGGATRSALATLPIAILMAH